MMKSPITDDHGNPQNFQNPIQMGKSVRRTYFPMRSQVSKLSYTPVGNKFYLGNQDIGVSLKRNANQKYHRMLREFWADLIPLKTEFKYGNNHRKNRQNSMINYIHFDTLSILTFETSHLTKLRVGSPCAETPKCFYKQRFRLLIVP